MYFETKNEITNSLKSHIAKKRLSQRQVADLLGVNVATINNVLTRKWETKINLISTEMWARLKVFTGIQTDVVRATQNLVTVQNVVERARKLNKMYSIVAEPGYGKTTALEYLASRTDETYYLLVDKYHRPPTFLRDIGKSMGLHVEGKAGYCRDKVVSELKKKENPVFLLDDMGKANNLLFPVIQNLYDLTVNRGHGAIVIAGVEELRSKVNKMRGKGRGGFPEFNRRVARWIDLKKPTVAEYGQMASDFGIQDKKSIQFLYRNCGNLASLKDTLEEAAFEAENDIITYDHLLAVS